MPTDPQWSGGVVLDDCRELDTVAPVERVFQAVSGVGGARGWHVAEPLWDLRGFADRLLGGPGMRRGGAEASMRELGRTLLEM